MMTADQIREEIAQIEQEKAATDAAIRAAKRMAAATGQYSDRSWLLSAERAARKKGLRISALQRELGSLTQAERQARHAANTQSFEREFIRQARIHLPQHLYQLIVFEVNRARQEDIEKARSAPEGATP